jgi:predicted P-loop ATPase/GTPase
MRKALVKLTDAKGSYELLIPCDGDRITVFNKIYSGIKTFTENFSIIEARIESIHFMEVENYEHKHIPEREPTIN